MGLGIWFRVKLTLGCSHSLSKCLFQDPLSSTLTHLLAGKHAARQQMMAQQLLGSLQPMWENWIEFWVLALVRPTFGSYTFVETADGTYFPLPFPNSDFQINSK